MKRTLVFTMLLIANLVLLVHAVVPHHHHDAKVCFSIAHCQSCGHDAHQEHDHHHHDQVPFQKDDLACCQLKDEMVVTVQKNQVRLEPLEIPFSVCGCFAVVPHQHDVYILPTGLPFRHKPFLISFLNPLCSLTNGLRAPPVG